MRTHTKIAAKPAEISSLASHSWDFFGPLLNRYDYALGEPGNRNRAVEIEKAVRFRGEKGCCTSVREGGERHVLKLLQPYHFQKSIESHEKLYYTSAGTTALTYDDLDGHHDYHRPEDIAAGRACVASLDPALGVETIWYGSDRGANGYKLPEVGRADPKIANSVFDLYEQGVKKLLAQNRIVADYETKGTYGYLGDDRYHCGRLGKLPIHRPEWNPTRLDEFLLADRVPLARMEAVARHLNDSIPDSVLLDARDYRRRLKRERMPELLTEWCLIGGDLGRAAKGLLGPHWHGLLKPHGRSDEEGVWLRPSFIPRLLADGIGPWVAITWGDLIELRARYGCEFVETLGPERCEYRLIDVPKYWNAPCGVRVPQNVLAVILPEEYEPFRPSVSVPPVALPVATCTVNEVEMPVAVAVDHGTAGVNRSLTASVSTAGDLADEPDSFKRQLHALLPLARRLRRVPDLAEALAFIRDNDLFTGAWADNEARRESRVQWLLGHIATTFDPARCGTAGSVPLGKYDGWVERKFPDGVVEVRRSRRMNEDGEVVTVEQATRVPAAFLKVMMPVLDLILVTDPNDNHAVPHRRAEEVWRSLVEAGETDIPFDARKWAAAREVLHRLGVVNVYDREFRCGKAMRWEVGLYFPGLGLWKKSPWDNGTSGQAITGDVLAVPTFPANRPFGGTPLLITKRMYLTLCCEPDALRGPRDQPPRPPPDP